MKLRLLTYNIHKGFNWNNKNYFLSEIKELIQKSRSDIVFLQEVTGQNNKLKKNGLIDVQFEFLADNLWQQFAYAKNAVYDHGHHGNLILSKYPILNWENINLSTNSFEKRGMLLCQIQIPELNNKEIHVANLHLDLFQNGRAKQYQTIKNKILAMNLENKTPLIIAGDFNDWNKKASNTFEIELQMSEVFKSKHQSYAKTFPAAIPLLTLDRIYVKNLNIISSQVGFVTTYKHFSDHLPLICEVEFEK